VAFRAAARRRRMDPDRQAPSSSARVRSRSFR
jgi:hypothetical protein